MTLAENDTEEAPMDVAATAATKAAKPMQSEFSPELLRVYYARLFPYREMFQWMSHGNDPDSSSPLVEKDYFLRREICFTLKDDVYVRYNCFRDAAEFQAGLQKRQPYKIDVGAVFSLPPRDHKTVRPGAFQPVERELIFDIDLTDYDDVRRCCQGAKICNRCWRLMVTSVNVLDEALREDFGFKHIFWVYSGRRGVHCWVNDKEARALPNDARASLVDFLSVHCGNENTTEKTNLRFPLHPSLKRAYGQMVHDFPRDILCEEGQGYFEDLEGCEKILKTMPSKEMANELMRRWSSATDVSTAEEKWAELCNCISMRESGGRAQRRKSAADYQALEEWKTKLVFEYMYPRLDANVSKTQNHLLKSPWSIHPKTGRVCVPFLATEVTKLDPFAVPTVRTLCDEIDAYGAEHAEEEEQQETPDVDKTSMASYLALWKRHFLDGLYSDIRKERRDQMDERLEF
eukprot:scaffold1330_cov240-Pinguiococcus_pyrenoidosus.AAC.8